MAALEQTAQLEAAITALEAQRAVLGDAVVDLAVAPLRQQLAELRQTAASPPAPSMEGEHKLVTLLFADIAGFTALAEDLGAEQVRGLTNACFDHLVPVIRKYDGTVDKFVGDGVIALFGAPATHENDPERALRAALEMQDALLAFNEAHGTDLGLHFGINTGVVVAGGIGSRGRQEYSVMGPAVNIASRLEDISERGEILVGPETYRLTAPLFDFEPLAPLVIKGLSEPLAIFRLLGRKAEPGSVRGIEGLRSQLVGREAELGRLRTLLGALPLGRGGKIAIIAEAGQGKSRLVTEARRSLAAPVRWVEGRALSYAEGMSYFVARSLLQALLGVDADTPPAEVAEAAGRGVERCFPDGAAEVYPYLARLLEVPLEGASAETVQYLLPEALQRRMVQAFCDYTRASARVHPLVMVWEDLHWADPSSLHLLEALLPVTEEVPLLLLLVFRPEEGGVRALHSRARAAYGERYPVIALKPLTADESVRLLHNLLQIEQMPEATLQLILAKAEGNAFFLEEVLRSLLDAGLVILQEGRAVATRDIAAIDVPNTLQGVIAARIDRLPPENKQTLQTASVIGRVFQQRLLAQLIGVEAQEQGLERALRELREREFIRLRATPQMDLAALLVELEYIFKHAVTQDVAYHSLLAARRKELHRCVGEAVEALFPDRLDELAASLAYHYERAEERAKAIHYFTRAADRARATFANTEAISFYRSAVALVNPLLQEPAAVTLNESLGDVLELTGQRDQARAIYQEAMQRVREEETTPAEPAWLQQSRLYRKIGRTWERQYQHDEAAHAYARAGEALGEERDASDAVWWQQWLEVQLHRVELAYWSDRVPVLAELTAQVRPLVEQHATAVQRAVYYRCLVMLGYRRERLVVSAETVTHSLASWAASQETGNPVMMGMPRFCVGFSYLLSGDLDRAEEHLQACLELAERTGDVTVQARCLTYLSVVHRKRRQVPETRLYSQRTQAVAGTTRMLEYIGAATGNLAWAAWREGDLTAAQAQGRLALEQWRQYSGVFPFRWIALWPLIGIDLTQDRPGDAMEHARALLDPSQQRLPDALATVLETAVQAWDAGQTEGARGQLQQAMELAQEMEFV